jgi:iron complex outermembrane recepter protein
MFKQTKVCTGVLLALGGALLVPVAAQAQDTQRIEVTGSRIKRTDSETFAPSSTSTRFRSKLSIASKC